MGRSILSILTAAVIFTLLPFSSKDEFQFGKGCPAIAQFDWNEILDSMMAVQLRTAVYASEMIEKQNEARRGKALLHFLSDNAMANDTIVFIEPIRGLTAKTWTLMSFVWVANEKDSVCFYCLRDTGTRENTLEIRKSKKRISELGHEGLAQLHLCKTLDKDSLKVLHSQGPPHIFDMMVTELMGTRVMLHSDYSFKIDCITFENFIIPEI